MDRDPPTRLEWMSGLVGAGRFERPTPCAQVGFRRGLKVGYFQCLLFQTDAADLL
jgi:hypothetical protein